MSGCFTQRGEFAAVNKFARAEMAVRNGADLVLELPTPWAVSGAERFARGGVELLKKTGLVTHLAFGSECGDLEALQRVEACLSAESFQETLRRRLEGGETFARCRQAAVEELLDPRDAALLSQPNNILAIEYLKALRRADFSMEPITFPRRGGPHDGGAADGIASASHIRRLLRAGHTEEAMAFLPRESAEVLRREIAAGRGPVDMHTCQRAILARLRTMSQEDFLPYDGGGEGLYRRFYRAVRQATDMDGLLEAARTRRYPLARQTERRFYEWMSENGYTKKDIHCYFHGSKNQNYLGLLSEGPLLNPDAPITGKMFGYGIYLAPRAKKSINYTDISGSVWAKGKKHRAYLAVYKTAYNNAKDIYTWTSSMTGYRASNIFPNDAVFAHKGSSLINDEVIIYREEQLTIQYLIELQI